MEATPRPWAFDPNIEQIWSPEGLVATVKQRGPLVESDGDFRLLETEANGELIVKAVNAHDRLIEALEEIEVRAQMAQGRDAKLSPESEVYILLDIMRHLQGDARSALAAARGEGE